jgi:16S rRNA (adenine1518-N6/adenine1519-N6)-dimethyltransferase
VTPPGRRPPLSQHFLHDARAAARIAGALRAPPGARVLEIGPGEGALTRHLLDRGWRVTAVELDHGLAGMLAERWGDRDGFEVVQGDALAFSLPPGSGPWWIIGNLPYAITTPLLFRLLAEIRRAPIAEMVFMVQKEVADRLAAHPGTKAYGSLTVGVALVADVEVLFDIGPGSFRPPPRVRSSVFRLVPHRRWPLEEARRARLQVLAQRLFGQRRKQLQKALRTLEPWRLDAATAARVGARAGIDLSRRPETLTAPEWLALDAALEDEAGPA